MLQLPTRKSTRLPHLNYVGQKFYFVTICCINRKPVFLSPKLSHWLLTLLRSQAVATSFKVHAYCLMPDHLHFLAEGTEPTSDLLHFVKSFKIRSSRQYDLFGRILWQERFYDHVLRSLESVEPVAWYIWLNPVRKGLVERPHEYPFAGSCTGRKMPTAWSGFDWCPPWKRRNCPNP